MIFFTNIRRIVKSKAPYINLRCNFKALLFGVKVFVMDMQDMKFILYIEKFMRFLFQQLPSLKDRETIKNRNKNAIALANYSYK